MSKVNNPLINDVEASGFGATNYPIEIGLTMNDGDKFCVLIMPAPDWTHWDEEKAHLGKKVRSRFLPFLL